MKTRRLLLASLCGPALFLGSAVVASTPPNVLLIVTDDQGAQMGALGTPGLSTPNMDSIAASGVLFQNAFVPHPTCSVSRASIMTGTLPHTHGTLVNVNEFFGPDPTAEAWFANQNSPYNRNTIDTELPTLIEELDDAGYRTAVTSKLHLSTHDRFPFDVWIDGEVNGTDVASGQAATLQQFMSDSSAQGDPFFAMVNIRSPHRPLNNFQTNSQPDPDPNVVEIPDSLPDTPAVRDDWVRYLKAIQRTDDIVGEALQALDASGQAEDTVVIFMGDHGPAYHSAKWTPYDFGLRVPMAISGPGVRQGAVTTELASSLDLMSTILDLAGEDIPSVQHGESLAGVLADANAKVDRDYVVGELIHPSGLQERSIHGQRYHLIHRSNTSGARLVPADNDSGVAVWGNGVYQETIDQQAQFPAQFELLRQIDNGDLGGTPLTVELYDLENDRWEMNNLADDPAFAPHVNRLSVALQVSAVRTGDSAVNLFATSPAPPSNAPASGADNFDGGAGALDARAGWTTRVLGNDDTDLTIGGDVVDAPPGARALATFDGVELGGGDDFVVSTSVQFNGTGVGGGVVFGYTDADNFFEFQLLDGRSSPGGLNKDVRLRQRSGGAETQLLFENGLPNYAGGWYDVEAAYTAELMTLDLTIQDPLGDIWFQESVALDGAIDFGSLFGISSWSSNTAEFDDFTIDLTAGSVADFGLLGDFNSDGFLTLADLDLLVAAFGASTPATSQFNLATPDEMIDDADVTEWLGVIVPLVNGVGPADGDYNLDGVVDADDWLAWRSNFGVGGAGLAADGNLDGVVNAADYTVWRDSFIAATQAAGAPAAAPEPSAAATITLALAAWSSTRRRRRSRATS